MGTLNQHFAEAALGCPGHEQQQSHGPGAHGAQSRRAVGSPALAPWSLWLHTACHFHVVTMEGPFLDTRIAGRRLAMHGRFAHLATKVLIRESRSELFSTSSQRMQHSCQQQPSLWCPTMLTWHYRIRQKASPVSSSGDAISVTPHSAPQHHGPLFCHPLPIFWAGRAGRVSLPVQGPMEALLHPYHTTH